MTKSPKPKSCASVSNVQKWVQGLLTWADKAAEYEQLLVEYGQSCTVFDQDLKKGLLLELAPASFRTYLQIGSAVKQTLEQVGVRLNRTLGCVVSGTWVTLEATTP